MDLGNDPDQPPNGIGVVGPFQVPDPVLNGLPPSMFSLEFRFNQLLQVKADEWWLFYWDCLCRLCFSMLSGRVGLALILSPEDVSRAIDETLDWGRRMANSILWCPMEVSGLTLEPDPEKFRASFDDERFCELIGSQLAKVPMTFFDHVRSSIRRLITPPPLNATKRYPQDFIIRGAVVENEGRPSLNHLVGWDPNWGFFHWHQYLYSSTGCKVLWFTDPCTRDILVHALQIPDSAGWFSVFVPKDVPHDQLSSNVPFNIRTVSFVLAALVLEMRSWAGSSFNRPDVHADYIDDFRFHYNLTHAFLQSIQNGTVQTIYNVAEMQHGLAELLSLRAGPSMDPILPPVPN